MKKTALLAAAIGIVGFSFAGQTDQQTATKCDIISKILVKCMTYNNCTNAVEELAYALSPVNNMSYREKKLLLNYCEIECKKIRAIPERQKEAAIIGEYKALMKKCMESESKIYNQMPGIR